MILSLNEIFLSFLSYFLLIWKWYYPLFVNINNDTLCWMLHLYLSLYSSISISICIPPCFNLFFNQFVKTKIKLHLWKSSNQPPCWFTSTDSQLNLEMASQCFRFAYVWFCRFDLLRFYFIARSWFIRLNFFQPSRYINQGPIIETSFQKSTTKETTEDASFTWASSHIENSSVHWEAFSQGWWSASQQCWQTLPF